MCVASGLRSHALLNEGNDVAAAVDDDAASDEGATQMSRTPKAPAFLPCTFASASATAAVVVVVVAAQSRGPPFLHLLGFGWLCGPQ
jgi:hypothetical protein